MRYWLAFLLVLSLSVIKQSGAMEQTAAEALKGRILLQVEKNGEAWYVSPSDFKRYFLGRPSEALAIMQKKGLGISNNNLALIPIGFIDKALIPADDKDLDRLSDDLENSLGTDPQKADSDNDGYNDFTEIKNGYDPLSLRKTKTNESFTARLLGNILLQTEKHGEAWYLDPVSRKRYFLGRPDDAFAIMRHFGLGIIENDLKEIESAIIVEPLPLPKPEISNDATKAMSAAAAAIRSGDKTEVVKYFRPEMSKALVHTMDAIGAEGRLTLGNILSGSVAGGNCTEKCTFSNKAYFSLGETEVSLKFLVEKQADGTWLIMNL